MTDTREDLIREAHQWFVAAELFRYASIASCLLIVLGLSFLLIPALLFGCACIFVLRSVLLIREDQRRGRQEEQ